MPKFTDPVFRGVFKSLPLVGLAVLIFCGCGANSDMAGSKAANDDDSSSYHPPVGGGDDDDTSGATNDDDSAVGDDEDATPPPDEGDYHPPSGGEDPPPAGTLTAGATDDHAEWEAYLHYASSYRSGGVYAIDLNPRISLQVVDAEDRPVADAVLEIGVSGQDLIQLKTYSDGRTWFFPDSQSVTRNTPVFTIRARKESAVSNEVELSQESRVTLRLDSPRPEPRAIGLDLLFVVDTTGSMQDEIDQIRTSMESISWRVNENARGFGIQLADRYGLVRYRDRDDAYTVQKVDFTSSLDDFRRELDQTRAAGGGDYPEDVNRALKSAVREMDWETGEAVRILFLIADAPPHLDYGQDYNYLTETQRAHELAIRIYPIASSGTDDDAQYCFREMAAVTGARYLFLRGNRDDSSPGSGSSYTLGRLDDLIVEIVKDEMEPYQP